MKKRLAKRKARSKAGRGTASNSSASKNNDSIVDVAPQETQPSQEVEEAEAKVGMDTLLPVKEEKIEEELKENQEEEKEDVKPDVATHQEKGKEDVKPDSSTHQVKEKEDAKPDSATHQEKDQIVNRTDDANSSTHREKDQDVNPTTDVKGASSSQSRRPSHRKRKRSTTKKATEKEENEPTPTAKRARTTDPQDAELKFFKEKRSLEDLWKAAFPVGTEWGQLDALYEFNWDFTNLEEALEEGGQLYGKKVYVFGSTESHSIPIRNENKDVLVPTIVCIESSIPPSDKIGVASVQGEIGNIIPMKDMKMAWVPYIPLEKRDRPVDRMKLQIYILVCTQRRSALKHLKDDRVNNFKYCLPYIYNPFKEDETEQSTMFQITFPAEPPIVCEYDWAKNKIEEITDDLIKEETLPVAQKDEFMEFVQEEIEKAITANAEAKEAREKAKKGLSKETKTAYKEMKLYKFYPLPSSETPDVAQIKKSLFINRYFGQANEIL